MKLCSLPAIHLGPNFGGVNEDNGDLLQKVPYRHCHTQRPQPCSRPPPTHASTGDSWTPTGKSRTVSCGVTAPFSWVLVHKVLLCPPRVYLPVLCNFRRLYGVVNGDLFQEGYAIPKCAASRAPAPWQSTADPYPTGDAQTQFCLSLSGVPGSFHAQGLFEPSS